MFPVLIHGGGHIIKQDLSVILDKFLNSEVYAIAAVRGHDAGIAEKTDATHANAIGPLFLPRVPGNPVPLPQGARAIEYIDGRQVLGEIVSEINGPEISHDVGQSGSTDLGNIVVVIVR